MKNETNAVPSTPELAAQKRAHEEARPTQGASMSKPPDIAAALAEDRARHIAALLADPFVQELVQSLRYAIDNIQGIADGTDIPSIVIRAKARDLLTRCEPK